MTTSFAELGLNEQILAGVNALGFTQPTPVQEQSIPLVLEGRDLVASAQTGTGKTAAFALPTLQRIMGMAPKAAEPPVAEAAPQEAAEAQAVTTADGTAPKRRRRRRRRKPSASSTAGTAAQPLALVITPTRELAQQIERVVTTVC